MRISPTREALHNAARRMKKDNKEEEEEDYDDKEEEDLKKEVKRLNRENSRLRQRLTAAGLSCDDD